MTEGDATERNWRVRGWVLVGLGAFLVLFMGGIALSIAPAMLDPGAATGRTTFTGTPEQAQLFLGIFALVIGFGALCIANGAYMIATGRRSAALTAIMLAIFAILFAIGWAVRRKWIV